MGGGNLMKFPAPEFDDAVAALCHGTASAEQLAALHALLRSDLAARDEYLWQVEVHSRLATGAAATPERQTAAAICRQHGAEAPRSSACV